LRTIQQNDLPLIDPDNRVLGVIRPTSEIIGSFTNTNQVGILGTQGTVQSDSYPIEIQKFYPSVKVYQQACPMWVPLIENNDTIHPAQTISSKKIWAAA
jgi:glutamate racemase